MNKFAISAALLGSFAAGSLTLKPVSAAIEVLAAQACVSARACVAAENGGNGFGVAGTSAKGSGIRGITSNPSASGDAPQAGVAGYDRSTDGGTANSGVAGSSRTGAGVIGEASHGFGSVGLTLYGSVGAGGVSESSSAQSAAMVAEAPNGAAIFAGLGAGTASVTIDASANIDTTGQVFTEGACSAGCVVRRVRSYGTTAAAPAIEDTGEARLAGGTAFVRLDPAFANAIDLRQGYVVLVTPEGETRGLFVESRTAAGFLVRESMGGRSATAFAYRLVAHPYGVRAPRLPFVQTARPLSIRAPRFE